MRSLICRLISSIFLLYAFYPILPAHGDKIVLKDGSIEESDRIWESEKYVHFILKGTQDVEIRYSKEIVERIEHQDVGKKVLPVKKENIQAQHTDDPGSVVSKRKNTDSPSDKSNSVSLTETTFVRPNQSIISESKDIVFYDPRRPQRYWVSRTSRFNKLQAAMDALAKMYHKPTNWVEDNLGTDNDLSTIHANLIAALGSDVNTEGEIQSKIKKAPASEQTISKKTQQPFERVINNKGFGAYPAIPENIKFYDPRREMKYWSDLTHHHQTLKDAISSIAKEYGITPEWVENHMGDTNDLLQIHLNLRNSLTATDSQK